MPEATSTDLTTLLAEVFDRVVADWVKALGLVIVEARAGEVVLALPVSPPLVHGGGVLCARR